MAALTILCLCVVALNFLSPKVAEKAMWLVVLGLVFPLVTYVSGSIVWLMLNLLTDFAYADVRTWVWCCAGVGLPLAGATALVVRQHPPQ